MKTRFVQTGSLIVVVLACLASNPMASAQDAKTAFCGDQKGGAVVCFQGVKVVSIRVMLRIARS